jgi:hypothetical protein
MWKCVAEKGGSVMKARAGHDGHAQDCAELKIERCRGT